MDQISKREVRGSEPPGKLLSIARLLPAHTSEIIEIAKESFEVLWSLKDFLYFIDNKDGVCFGLFLENKLIAFCFGLDIQGDLDIVSIATDVEFRRKGMAGFLLEKILTSRKGEAFLEVDIRNVSARAFYQKMGFSEGRVRKSYYQGKYDAVCMAKRLG